LRRRGRRYARGAGGLSLQRHLDRWIAHGGCVDGRRRRISPKPHRFSGGGWGRHSGRWLARLGPLANCANRNRLAHQVWLRTSSVGMRLFVRARAPRIIEMQRHDPTNFASTL
jgi:hypothetical protein